MNTILYLLDFTYHEYIFVSITDISVTFTAENREELARFAKNFLPLLFNLFTTKPDDERDQTRQAVLETVKTYLQIADASLITAFFEKAHGKLCEDETSTYRRWASAFVSESKIGQLY